MASAELNLTLDQGSTFRRVLTLKDLAGQPIDLTGRSARGQIRKRPSSSDLVAEFECSIPTPANGQIVIQLPASTSSAISIPGASFTSPAIFVYDVEVYYGSGDSEVVDRILHGELRIVPEVTR